MKPKLSEISLNGRVEPAGLGLLLAPLGGEAGHLLVEGLQVLRLGLGADVAAGSEDVAVLADLLQRRALAEAGDVGVALTLTLSREERGIGSLSSPGVVGAGDAGEVILGQVSMGAVDHVAHLAGVDEEDFALAVAVFAIAATPGEEPEAGGYLG